ncbi:MAG: hypothetical protein IPK20_21845 [Betaproteobacteria bacterium]|nr:hypothetical protein [Betaproteobacteria bacterium]
MPAFRAEHLTDLSAFARLFFRGVFARLRRGLLVLDNFQDLPETSALLTALAAGFDEIPDGIQVLAVSRGSLPAVFSRLRASQRIAFFGWEEIRLTVSETAAIATLGETPGRTTFSEALLAESMNRPAGLQALRSCSKRVRQTGRIRRTGDIENLETVFDYFAAQIFDAAPASQRDMLIRMSYLPNMTAALAQAITGDASAGPLLAALARRNLFTDRRLGEDTSYQFHALFRLFLQTRPDMIWVMRNTCG